MLATNRSQTAFRHGCSGAVTEPRQMTSLNEFVTLYAVTVLLPDVFVFPAPPACQIRANKDIASAFVACGVVTSAYIE